MFPPLAVPFGRWREIRASLPRSAEVLRAVAELRTDPRLRAVTVGHPVGAIRGVVAPGVRHDARAPQGPVNQKSHPVILGGIEPRGRTVDAFA